MSPEQQAKYAPWIEAHAGEALNNGYGKCEEVTAAMVAAFPELERRKGFFHCGAWGQRAHWWCRVKGTATIVDPTGCQHPSGSWFPLDSEAYDDLTDCTDEELREIVPSGKCANCGGPVFGGGTVCGKTCHAEFLAYLNGGGL